MELQPDAPPAPVPSDSRDWSELPLLALTSVLAGLGAVDVLMGAGLVCHSWLEAAKTPELWREVDMGRGPRDKKVMDMDGDIDLDLSSQGSAFAGRMLPRQPRDQDHYSGENREVMCAMAKVAVDRSDGNLEVFVGAHFVIDEILDYIGARSPSLKRLALVSCEEVSCDGFSDLVNKCPLLEDIEVSGCKHVGGHAMVAAGRACPRLRRLVLNKPWRRRWDRWDAAGISTMRELRHLRISRSEIRNEELMAVVDGCPFLEHLSVADCCNIVVDDALRAKCAAVKTLELPASQDLDDLDAYEFGSLSYYVHVDNDWMSDPGWMF